MADLRELYQEVIIDHNRHPRNFKKLPVVTHYAEGFNPLCGDKLNLYLYVDNGIIQEASFEGAGCAISTASASLMTEVLQGKTLQQAEKLFGQFHALLTASTPTLVGDLGKLAVLSGVREYPSRIKCATLAWHTLQAAMQEKQAPVSTE